jgi:hypothetical protein
MTYNPLNQYSSDATPSATSSAASSLASSNPNGQFIITEQVLDFARVAVLFVLQQEDIDSAIGAQSALQHVFSLNNLSNKLAANLSLGGGNSIDLLGFSLDLGNGSVGWLNGSASKRAMPRRSLNLFGSL